ncbi:Rad9 [Moelleriella libera RCEF 2490]|uniref:DNA repair protein rad9 n=1 Tax=Moelleriella libera RCEF 2490 TaxID=1081109 RepID=A0A168A2E4_9HYPO|nr:Rad9 [Moelleriella libera RCEF 2490]
MANLSFTLSEDGVGGFRDALICLNKFSDDVSLEAREDLLQIRFRPAGQFRDRFYCTLYIRVSLLTELAIPQECLHQKLRYDVIGQPWLQSSELTSSLQSLISLFRSRSFSDNQRDAEKQTSIDRCDVIVQDGEGIKSRFIARVLFRNGLTSTHQLPFEVSAPVHAKFAKQTAPHHWAISSRTLRQLMDHLGPGIEYVDINTDGDHVNFTCFSEKTISEDAVLKKPLQTSISVEADEFDTIDVEDKLHIVVSVKDFRAIVQHAGIAGNPISARYSLPAKPIQLSYSGDALSCEFLVMTLGERGSNPSQRIRKGRKPVDPKENSRIMAVSRRASEAPLQATDHQPIHHPSQSSTAPARNPLQNPISHLSAARASASRLGAFDLRPSQKPPPPTVHSESLFVDDDGWEPIRDEDDDAEEDARLEWDHSADPNPFAQRHSQSAGKEAAVLESLDGSEAHQSAAQPTYLEPTQKLADVKGFALFPE